MKYFYEIIKGSRKNFKPMHPLHERISNDLWYSHKMLDEWIKIQNWDPNNAVLFDEDWVWVLEDYVFYSLVPCISEKLKNILEKDLQINKYKEQVQFLPVSLESEFKPLKIIKWYYLINILNIADIKKVRWRYPKLYEDWTESTAWYFIWEQLEWFDIFRYKGNPWFYISQRIKDELDKLKIKVISSYTSIPVLEKWEHYSVLPNYNWVMPWEWFLVKLKRFFS